MKYAEQILFTIVFGVVVYFATQETEISETNYKRGLLGALFVLIAESILKSFKSPFVRPHEGLWSCVVRFCLIYMCILVFLCFQKTTDARSIFKQIYPELGQPVPHSMHTYDDNCDFEWENIWDNLDHYYAIHLINWFCISLIVRDPWVLHSWSLLHEIIELSAQHILPHFRECWWDHIILDLCLSNTPAILFGLYLVNKFKMQPYDWLGRKGSKGFFDWKVWKCHRRFGGMFVIWMIVVFNFLCGFFMINSLWIPPRNWINIYRLMVWFLLSGMAFKELYTDIDTWGKKTRINNPVSGKFRWITFFVCFSETFISLKFIGDAGNILDNPTPLYISVPWVLWFVLSLIYYFFLRLKPSHTRIYPEEHYAALEDSKKKSQAIKAEKAESNKAKAEKTESSKVKTDKAEKKKVK